MQYNFWADLLSKFHTSSELVKVFAIIIAGIVIVALLVSIAYYAVKALSILTRPFALKSKRDEDFAEKIIKADEIIYDLIVKYKELNGNFLEKDKPYLEILEHRFKEGLAIISFIKNCCSFRY